MRIPRLKILGGEAFYHCVSRVVDRRLAFGDAEKEMFAKMLRRYAVFCGVEVVTFCVMGNHFHVLVKVPQRPAEGEEPDDAELLRRLGAVARPAAVRELERQLMEARAAGDAAGAEALRGKLTARMWDVSVFMKELKQKFTLWFNRRHTRRGTLWEERFRSTVVEGEGPALAAVAAYVDLNPVRAGIVGDAAEYRWSGCGRAAAGRPDGVAGLRHVAAALGLERGCRKGALLEAYSGLLDAKEGWLDGAAPAAGRQGRRPGAALGRSVGNPAEALRMRVRYFVDGAAIGGRQFVEAMARRHGAGARDTPLGVAHRFRGGELPGIFSLRNLRVKVYGTRPKRAAPAG